MTIKVNNKEVETNAKTLQQLAEEMNLPAAGVAMAMANKMVPRTEWATTEIAPDANIIIIKAVCGG